MFQAHPIGILALVAVVMCFALALVLYRIGITGSVARKLSLLLVVEAVTLVSTGYIDLLFVPAVTKSSWYSTWIEAELIVHTFGDCAMLALYPSFLAAALKTKLTRPFTNTRVTVGITIASGVLFFMVLLTPLQIGATLLYLMLSLLFGFALVASIHAWRTASSSTRPSARAFAIAFGVRDVCWGLAYGTAISMIWFGQYSVVDPDASSPIYLVYVFGTLFAVPLIAYGILRTHLFDIDLKIRWTIKQSTLAGVFIAIMYVISEGAAQFLSAELGNFAGLLAAAVVVFFLVPLQRFAESVAAKAMPNTQNTPEYATFRKMQVYEAALTEALEEGGITHKERALLGRLRDSLGISMIDAETMEHEFGAKI